MIGLGHLRWWSKEALALISLLVSAGSPLSTDSFDVREATIDGVHDVLFTGLHSCREIVSSFISRVEEFNPTVNAVISLNPDALSIADQMDAQIASGNATGSLFCIPTLLKDNFDAIGMNTTGGCLGLAGNRPTTDARVVEALKKEGAIILGKANLHEFALEGLTVSSLGGQTVNPYDLTRTPGGSSGGTGAAIAANFAILGTGTDTVNSLRSPASANSLFSFRPTRGLITRAGVIPVSYTQDTVGCMARNLKDLAVALNVMASAGLDPADNATTLAPPEIRIKDYTAALDGGSLKGLRLGLLNGFFNLTASEETTPVNNILAHIVSTFESAGAEVINITESIYNATAISAALDVQTSEYRESLNSYLSEPSITSDRPADFADLYASGRFLVIPAQHSYINTALTSSTSDAGYRLKQQGIRDLTSALHATFAASRLDALVYPEQKNLVVRLGSPSQSGRNGILAALTGSPVVTVPAGLSPPSAEAPAGVPVGLEILGLPWTEDRLLNIARHVSELVPVRRMPPFANASVETRGYAAVPVIRPDTDGIPAAYPVGVF
ncbi:amidase signature enzyme [Phialemonium atrogriseum]|uniref:Amidase signature enzyme n=1 Tax=Phialemonium atrogriseum TaxID=1093897 RepID=A0AAJ0C521_9PEZI|nr:amidase signature enzyme [Phialemonium atrogriseum]KAK1768859.1 amidase signature enzyme [Phialemonium atrogriseum]